MGAARRYLPSDPVDFARSAVPLGLLVLAAAVPGLRAVVLVVLAAGAAIAIWRDAPVRWAWAGAVPVALSLLWGGLSPRPRTCPSSSGRIAPTPPRRSRRRGRSKRCWSWGPRRAGVHPAGDPGVAVAALAGPPLGALGRRRVPRVGPGRARWSARILARPFFGDVGYELVAAAIVPALVFAAANGVMEEVIYRGALLGWSAKVMGLGPAVVGQAIVFGVAHSGADVIGLQLPLMLALGVGGLLAGVIAVRTRSLLIPMAVHIGLDIPIYFAFACGT